MADDGNQNDAQNQNDNDTDDTGDAGRSDQGNQDQTFSQADVDRIVKDRLARVKTTPPDDYEELKAAAAKLADIEAANKTELEKERDRADKAEQEAERTRLQARDASLRSLIIAEAAKPDRKVADAEAAFGLLTGIDKDLIEVDKDGNPTDIAKAMDSLLDKRPYLVADTTGGSRGNADQGARGGSEGQVSRDALKDMQPEEVRSALREGKLETVLKGGG